MKFRHEAQTRYKQIAICLSIRWVLSHGRSVGIIRLLTNRYMKQPAGTCLWPLMRQKENNY